MGTPKHTSPSHSAAGAITAPSVGLSKTAYNPTTLYQGILYQPNLLKMGATRMMGRFAPPRAIPLELIHLPDLIKVRGFERLRVRMCGISKADLSLVYGNSSNAISGMYSFPAVLGHEILAELGGVRVAVNPLLTCLERGLHDCLACARGEDNLCENVGEGNFSPGIVGFCSDVTGGWANRISVHRERIIQIGESVSDEVAVLAEPMATVLHVLRGALAYEWPNRVLVVGAGSTGLLTIKTLRVMGYPGQIHVAAQGRLSSELARTLGADRIHESVSDAQRAVGSKILRGNFRSRYFRGGFDAVINASSKSTDLKDSSWAVTEGGKLLMLGAPGVGLVDASAFWFRELKIFGGSLYRWDDFREAVQMLPEMEDAGALVTHRFDLEDWPVALRNASRPGALKVVFRPS